MSPSIRSRSASDEPRRPDRRSRPAATRASAPRTAGRRRRVSPSTQAMNVARPSGGPATATPRRSHAAGGSPRRVTRRFDQCGHDEQHAKRTGQRREVPERPGRSEPARAQGEEHADSECQCRGVGVAQDERTRRRQQRREPRGATRESGVAGLEQREAVQQRPEQQRREVGDDQERDFFVPAEEHAEPTRAEWHEREEPQCLAGQCVVAVLGDGAVDRRRPRQTDLGRAAPDADGARSRRRGASTARATRPTSTRAISPRHHSNAQVTHEPSVRYARHHTGLRHGLNR